MQRLVRILSPLLLLSVSIGASFSYAADTPVVSSTPFTSESFPVSTGTWRYTYAVDTKPVYCNVKEAPNCIRHVLTVQNDSGSILECMSELTYSGANGEGTRQVHEPYLVLPHKKDVTLRDTANPDTTVTAPKVACTERAMGTLPTVPAGCGYKTVYTASLDDFYPETSRRLNERGPVILAFTLPSGQSQATQIQVLHSSLYSRIDEAAVAFLQQIEFQTPCPGTRYPFVVRFELND